jgi:esterase/lipase superfamily enzyme/cytochrome c556
VFVQGRCVVTLLLLHLVLLSNLTAQENAELDRLKKQLASPVPSQKVQAAGKLAQLGKSATSAADQLIACLEDNDPDVRLYAANALAHVSTDLPRSLRGLVDVLADRDEHVRYAAEWAIAYLAKSISANPKIEAKEQAKVLENLQAALKQLSQQEHQPRHAQAVKQAISTLTDLAKKTEPPAVKAPTDAELAQRAAAKEVETITQQFQKANRIDRFNLVESIYSNQLHRQDIVRAIMLATLQSNDSRLAEYAVDRWNSAAQNALKDLFSEVQETPTLEWSGLLLQHFVPSNEKMISRLLALATQPTLANDLRSAALLTLGKSTTHIERIRIALTEILEDESEVEQVRVSAVNAMAKLGEVPNSLQNRLLTVLNQPRLPRWLQSELVTSLHKLNPNSTDTAVAIANLLRATDVGDAAYADLALALGGFGPRGVVGLQELIAGLASNDEHTCVCCVKGLHAIGTPSHPATSALVSLITNPQVPIETKSATALALRAIGPSAIDRLVEQLPEALTTGREHTLQVLAIIGPDARSALPACCGRAADKSESLRVRVAALNAIGAIGLSNEDTIALLNQCVTNEQQAELRSAAILALAQVHPGSATALIPACESDADFTVRLSGAFAKHLTGQTTASFRTLLSLLGNNETDALVEDAILDMGHVALPLLLNTSRDRLSPSLHRIVCMHVASRLNPVDWPPLIELLADESLGAQFADAMLAGWNFDKKLLPQLLSAFKHEQSSLGKAQIYRMAEYLTSDLGAVYDANEWTGGFAISHYLTTRSRQVTANELERSMQATGAIPSLAHSSSAMAYEEEALLIPEPVDTSKQLAATAADLRQVKVFYGTNRKPLDQNHGGFAGDLSTTFAASIGLAIAACATCVFGFLRRKSPAYAFAALAGLGSVSTLAVFGAFPKLKDPNAHQVKYGGDYSSIVELGMCEVSIPESHRPGELESPALLLRLEVTPDPNKHIVLKHVKRLAPDEFYSDLHTELDHRGNNILVFVHGYNVSFEDAARRTAQMSYDLKFPGAPVFYSWPSQANWYRYRTDRENIENSVEQIKGFLTDLSKRTQATTINLVAHSMGNVGLTAALSAMDGDAQFNQIVLAAPDIDAATFQREIAPRVVTRAKRVTLYTSKTDLALIASKYFNHGARAGDSGSEMLLVPGIQTIDATAVDSSLLGHSYYGSNVNVLFDLGELLSGKPIEARSYLQPSTNSNTPYWYFDPKSIARQPNSSIVPLRR